MESIGGVWDRSEAVAFERRHSSNLINTLFCAAAFGWSWAHDIYLVPDSREAVLMIDHHDAAFATFPTGGECERYVEAMRCAGFELPTTPPDETFKPAPWMKS